MRLCCAAFSSKLPLTLRPHAAVSEVVAILGKERSAPKLGDVRLPLRSKDQFMTALNMSNLLAALKPGVAALEECRHAGEAMQPGEAVAVVRERAVGWHMSRKVAVKKLQSAATAVVLGPPRRDAVPTQPPQPLSPAGSVSDPEDEEGLAQALQDVTAAAEHAAAQEEAAMEAEAQQASENGQEAAQ